MKAYLNLLFSSHMVFIRVQVLNLSGDYLYDVSDRLLDGGQVDYDADGDTESTASLSFYDPDNAMDIDTNSPNDGAMFMDRMVRILHCIAPPDGSLWYEVPIFCGPMTKVDRTDNFVDVECSGKEYLLYSSVWNPQTYKKGRPMTDVMKDIARDYGESKLNIPNLQKSLVKEFALGGDGVPWKAIKALAKALNRQVFYDGRGTLNLKARPSTSVFTFDETMMTGKPQIGFDNDKLINAVKVIGAKPKGKGKKKVKAVVRAPRSHPLSPWSLGRDVGGVRKPRYYMAVIEDEKLKTAKDCKAVAKNRLRQGLIESVSASWDSLVVPVLQMNDLVRVKTDTFTVTVRVRKASFSLSANSAASYGYTRNLSPAKKKIRRFKK